MIRSPIIKRAYPLRGFDSIAHYSARSPSLNPLLRDLTTTEFQAKRWIRATQLCANPIFDNLRVGTLHHDGCSQNKKLIDLLQDSDIAEIEIKEGEDSVRISRTSALPAPVPMGMPMQAPIYMNAEPPRATVASAPSAAPAPAETGIPSGHVIESPMVGTFYRASSPGAKFLWKSVKVSMQVTPYALSKR